jgi:hypothetical protein
MNSISLFAARALRQALLEKVAELHHTQLKTLGPEIRRMLARLAKV